MEFIAIKFVYRKLRREHCFPVYTLTVDLMCYI